MPTSDAKTTRPKTSLWLWPALALVVAGGIFAAVEATSGASNSGSATADYEQRPQDVTIKTCGVQNGRLAGSIDVTNRTTTSSTYAVKVTFESPDGQVVFGVGNAIVSGLDPGAASGPQQIQITKRMSDAPVKCVLSGAARYSS